MSKWRTEVGDDFFPALRLIIPEKDKDRPMYGLKELSIARLIVKLLSLPKNSEDGYNLLSWKMPARGLPSKMAGDFPGRCYEVLSRRPVIQEFGNMSIAEVNQLLDELSAAQKEDQQLPIFRTFYEGMNAQELMWLIRIILRQMKIGSTEKTILNVGYVPTSVFPVLFFVFTDAVIYIDLAPRWRSPVQYFFKLEKSMLGIV